jgi:Uri superfamily endonuclease
MKGAYILIVELSGNVEIRVGKLGRINFRKGFYAYVGSAMNGLENRIGRHLRKGKKRFWYVDYLLENADVRAVVYKESTKREECTFARNLRQHFNPVQGFGCSDCRCGSHLFFSKSLGDLRSRALKVSKGKILRKNPI